MKVFLSLLATVLISCGSASQEDQEQIGIIEGGEYVITMDENTIKENFENILREQDNDAVLTRFEIISDENEEGGYYMLVGYSDDNMVKIAVELNLVQRVKFYGGFSDSVTCNGCTSGCHPYGDKTGWNCKDPCDECSKSETINY